MKLQHLGWNDRFESLFGSMTTEDLARGRVTRVDRGAVTVQMEDGIVAATLAGRLDPDGEFGPAAVGDWVGLEVENAIVRVILPRAGALARRRPGGADHEQVAAANVDLVLIVESVERGPNPRRIERAVALAWDAGATPVVVLTKLDLCNDHQAAIGRAREGASFAEVLTVSAKSGEGVEKVSDLLSEGMTAVLLGPSGVGKSTLTNALLGEERLVVAGVREGDRKGRHTTTFRELFVLPNRACLIDTPGIRELGLWLDAEAVGAAFPEIEEAARRCRFGDCRHETEPGCAVLEEVEGGIIDPARLASFLRLRREADSLSIRRDESRRHEIRARERSFGRMVREAMRHKKDR